MCNDIYTKYCCCFSWYDCVVVTTKIYFMLITYSSHSFTPFTLFDVSKLFSVTGYYWYVWVFFLIVFVTTFVYTLMQKRIPHLTKKKTVYPFLSFYCIAKAFCLRLTYHRMFFRIFQFFCSLIFRSFSFNGQTNYLVFKNPQ